MRQVPHQDFAEAVLAELQARARSLQGPRELSSVYIGGGTPSLWDPLAVGSVLSAVKAALNGRAVEATLECNPSGLTQTRLEGLLASGINRLSIGVQSLRGDRLRWLGRTHGPREAAQAVQLAVRVGFHHVSADLLFGLPGQPVCEVVADARCLVDLGVDHLSAYELTLEKTTPLGRWAKRAPHETAGENAVLRTYAALERAMKEAGLEHYEVSNYARPGCRSIHNVGYWRGQDYVGLGPGACGTLSCESTVRYRNTASWEVYRSTGWRSSDLARAGPDLPQVEREVLDPECRFRERLMLGLRLKEGIDVSAAATELGVVAWTPERRAALERWLARGGLCWQGRQLCIPHNSWRIADAIIADVA